MSLADTIQDKYNELNAIAGNGLLGSMREKAFESFNKLGIPTSRNEEWKYTRLAPLANKNFALHTTTNLPSEETLKSIRLQTEYAAELFFVNGVFVKEISSHDNEDIVVLPLNEAVESGYKNYVQQHLNQSSKYMKDGMNALNTAFIANGLFVLVKKINQLINRYLFIILQTQAVIMFLCSQEVYLLLKKMRSCS
jgi:Fe-S cluster assembly protein SufD